MHSGRRYENQTLLAVRLKRVIARKHKSRKNTGYSVVSLQKRGEISGVSVRHATYGWRHLVTRKREPMMQLADTTSVDWLSPFLFSFRVYEDVVRFVQIFYSSSAIGVIVYAHYLRLPDH
jgi:hypothetical protein